MKLRSVLILCQLAFVGVASGTQGQTFPPDLSKLVARAQEIRTLLAAGQMIESLEFILPDKRNVVLSGGRVIYRNPQVVGVDLTDDPNRVIVRVAVEMPALGGSDGRSAWVARDTWVWIDDLWYLDAGTPFSEMWRGGGPGAMSEADIEEVEKEFDEHFKLLDDFIDVGTLDRGDPKVVRVRIQYSGDTPITITTTMLSEFLILNRNSARGLSSEADSFDVLLDTARWEGPFRMPLPITIEYKGALIDRTVTIAGTIFTPLTIEREAVDPSESSEDHVRLSIHNNTDTAVLIAAVLVDDKLDVMGFSPNIAPAEKGFIDLRRRAGVEPPGELTLILIDPVLGRRAVDIPVDFGPR